MTPTTYTLSACCKGLKGFQLAWHRYAAHGGPYPRKSRREREKKARKP